MRQFRSGEAQPFAFMPGDKASIEAGWTNYRTAAYSGGIMHEVQELECRQAFYAGVVWFFSALIVLQEGDQFEAQLEMITAELETFGQTASAMAKAKWGGR